MQSTNEELWRVQLGTGEIRMMDLDALDEAFNEGLIDAHAPVLAPGSAAWTTLGEAAGLHGPTPKEMPSLSPFAVSSAPSSSAMVMPEAAPSTDGRLVELDLDELELELKPRRRRALVVVGVVGAVAVAATFAMAVGKLGGEATADVKGAIAVEAPPEAVPLPPPVAKDSKPKESKPEENKPVLTDDQKQKLLDADKARDDKARLKNQEKAEKVQAAPKKKPMPKSNGPFINGGDRFDPLNGAL